MSSRAAVYAVLCAALVGCRFNFDRVIEKGDLRGRVVVDEGDGKLVPATGAEVRLTNSSLHLKADSQGRFVIHALPPGSYGLSLTYDPQNTGHPIAVLGFANLGIAANDGFDLGTVTLAVAGSISGTVVLDASGQPVANAALTVVDGSGNPILGLPVARSDASGHYVLPYVVAPNASVEAFFVDQQGQAVTATSKPVTIQPRQQSSADIRLNDPVPAPTVGSLIGKATYANGVDTVSVQLTGTSEVPPQNGLPSSGFEIGNIPSGIYTVTISATNLVPVVIGNVVIHGRKDLGSILFTASQTQADTCNGQDPNCLADEACQSQNGGCDLNATCTNNAGVISCLCNTGFEGDGRTCFADPCLVANGGCDQNATCQSTFGRAACTCSAGYSGPGSTCIDIDECQTSNGGCDVNATCTNTPGSFSCTCKEGYVGDGLTCDVPPQLMNELLSPSVVTKAGQEVSVTFDTTKLVDPKLIVATIGTSAMTCTEPSVGEPSYQCLYMSTGTETAPGTLAVLPLTIKVVDAAGGASTLMDNVTFDFRPVLTVDQSKLQYLRSPWGGQTAETVGSLQVFGGPFYAVTPQNLLMSDGNIPASTFALDTGTVASLVFWADSAGSQMLGTAMPNPDGSWPSFKLPFMSSLPQSVWVSGVDKNGNTSAPQKIKNVEWVATPYLNVTHGSTLVSRVKDARVQDAEASTPLDPRAANFGIGGDAAAISREAMTWRKRTPSASLPKPRAYSAMAYDSDRDQLVLFGGDPLTGQFLGDTWVWDGQAWSSIPTVFPAARRDHSMVFDSARGRVLLYGGNLGGVGDPNIYEWSGSGWSQVNQTGQPTPPARAQAGMVYDAARGVTYVFGGVTPGTTQALGDFWSWDGTKWTELTPATLPPARYGEGLAYDSSRAKVVLYGGTSNGSDTLIDTWEWDGSAWTQAPMDAGAPGVANGFTMVYAPSFGQTILLGNTGGPQGFPQGWSWDGSSWITADFTPSEALDGTSIAYDSALQRALVFGGSIPMIESPVNELQALDFSSSMWTTVTPGVTAPSARSHQAMAVDSNRGVTVLFGGSPDPIQALAVNGETWEWNGYAWTQFTPTNGPAPRAYATMAFDPNRGVMVMYGGQDANANNLREIWEWDGSTWTNKTPGGLLPSACCRMGAAYDAGHGQMVFFGGVDSGNSQAYNETWTWDGTNFVQQHPDSSPSGRRLWSMAYDNFAGYVFLFGGQDQTGAALGDLWIWDGSNWAQRGATGFEPPARAGAAMYYDSANSRVNVFGGFNFAAGQQFSDEWAWDERNWTQLATVSAPGPRSEVPMIFDDKRGQAVLFGGTDQSNGVNGELWEQNTSPARMPAYQFDANLSAESIDPSAVQGLVVRGFCGGLNPAVQMPAGSALWGWNTGDATSAAGWRQLASNNNQLNGSSPFLDAVTPALFWQATSTKDARAFIEQRDLVSSFQCRPIGGGDGARVGVAYFEVRVQYTSP